MERLKFEIKENPDLKTKTLFEIQIYQDKWELWYKESNEKNKRVRKGSLGYGWIRRTLSYESKTF